MFQSVGLPIWVGPHHQEPGFLESEWLSAGLGGFRGRSQRISWMWFSVFSKNSVFSI